MDQPEREVLIKKAGGEKHGPAFSDGRKPAYILHSPYGYDGFLIEADQIKAIFR